MKVEIITIGDEILIGQVVDTNSAWMAVELNQVGIAVAQITTISDTPSHLVKALNEASQRADVVLITGGLGPTKDDRTKKVLCEYFDSSMITHEQTLKQIQHFFEMRGLPVNQLNIDQALVPVCCEVLFNSVGTAPGMWFEEKEKIFVSMPGVPFEMKQLMSDQIIPRLKKLNGGGKIIHQTILTQGIAESILAEKLETWEDALPEYIHLAYLPSPLQIRLRLSAFGNDETLLRVEVDAQIEKLKLFVPEAIFGYNDDTMAGVVGKCLTDKGATMGSAESCTGGFIAHSITSVPGCSSWFKGSVIAYSNQIKENVLNVSSHNIDEFGAVSEQVVIEMAQGARKVLDVDYAVATSGVAGPDGGTPDKPVGTVWVAVASPHKTVAHKFNYSNNRERNIIRSSQAALNMLRLLMLNEVD